MIFVLFCFFSFGKAEFPEYIILHFSTCNVVCTANILFFPLLSNISFVPLQLFYFPRRFVVLFDFNKYSAFPQIIFTFTLLFIVFLSRYCVCVSLIYFTYDQLVSHFSLIFAFPHSFMLRLFPNEFPKFS